MTDFQGLAAYDEPPPFLSTWSQWSGLLAVKHVEGGASNAQTGSWATANQARYVPISIPWPYLVRRVFFGVGSVGGANVDFGVYTMGGVRLFSTGSTAQSVTSDVQFVDVTDFLLDPGDYYFAFNCDSGAGNRIWGRNVGFEVQRFGGVLQEAVGAVTLPATATFETPSVAGLCFCGVTWTDSGF